jgi:protein involved in polysaccharide export with SLBB domain
MLTNKAGGLSPAARQRIRADYRIDATDAEAQPLKNQLQRFGGRQPACRPSVDRTTASVG